MIAMIGADERTSKESYNMMEKNCIKCGIVASKLDYNGYVKFSNGFTIQWGNNTSPIGYPIAFSENPINLRFHKTETNGHEYITCVFRYKRKCEK